MFLTALFLEKLEILHYFIKINNLLQVSCLKQNGFHACRKALPAKNIILRLFVKTLFDKD